MNKKLLTTLICFLTIFSVNAQQIYKSNGTSFSTFLFGYCEYAKKSQLLYTPADLTNEQPGNITRLYFKYGTTNLAQQLINFSVKLGQTGNNSFPGDLFYTGLTTVMSRDTFNIPVGGASIWFTIDLDSQFSYNSAQSLIAQIQFDTSLVQSWGTLGTTNTPAKKIISPDVNATVGDPSSGTWQDMGFDLAPVTGIIQHVSTTGTFDIYPNPANDKVFYESFSNSKKQIKIRDVAGKTVFYKETENLIEEINTSYLSKGVYLFQVSSDGNTETKKLVVN